MSKEKIKKLKKGVSEMSQMLWDKEIEYHKSKSKIEKLREEISEMSQTLWDKDNELRELLKVDCNHVFGYEHFHAPNGNEYKQKICIKCGKDLGVEVI